MIPFACPLAWGPFWDVSLFLVTLYTHFQGYPPQARASDPLEFLAKHAVFLGFSSVGPVGVEPTSKVL